MKIFGDWVVKNEARRIEASLRSVLPFIDQAVLIDTGSSDDTVQIARAVAEDASNLTIIEGVDIGPNFDMSIARNLGLRTVPPEFWLNETTWYMETAGDEVYDESIAGLRPMMEKMADEVLWVYLWGREWYVDENGEQYIKNPKFGRPRLYRHVDGMLWEGVWNRERMIYPNDVGSYFPLERMNNRTKLYWDADIWYDHYGWADDKRQYRTEVYQDLAHRESKGEISHPGR